MNIGQLTRMAHEMQANMARVQQELRDTTVEATVGGGAVRVVMIGAQELHVIEIDPATVAEEKMAAVTGGMGLPGLPGLR